VVALPGARKLSPQVKCDEYAQIRWDFIIKLKKHDEGFLVQQVVSRCDIKECKDCGKNFKNCPVQPPKKASVTYYEAWHVPADSARTDIVSNEAPPYTDRALKQNADGDCGALTQEGTIKFFSIKLTGDLRKKWNPMVYLKGKKCQIDSGQLPAFPPDYFLGIGPKTPDFWDKPALDGPATRSFTDVYNCCDKNKQQKNATAVPDIGNK
jgi:hypothetical protein